MTAIQPVVAAVSGTIGFVVGWAGATMRAAQRLPLALPQGEWVDGLYHNRRGWWFQRWTGEYEGPFQSKARVLAARDEYDRSIDR